MSNSLRIIIAVVVLGLAATGIAVRSVYRAHPEAATAAKQVSKASQEPKSALAGRAQGQSAVSQKGHADPAACEVKGEVCEPVTRSKTTTKTGKTAESGIAKPTDPQKPDQPSAAEPSKDKKLPKLVDLGKGTCIPCKKMLPILQELQTEFKGRAVIEIIDLRDQPEAAMIYGLRLIPTQIFFDSEGKEVWRHEGFLAKEDVIKKLKELGVE